MSYTLTYTPIYSLKVTTIQNILLNANLFHCFFTKSLRAGKNHKQAERIIIYNGKLLLKIVYFGYEYQFLLDLEFWSWIIILQMLIMIAENSDWTLQNCVVVV